MTEFQLQSQILEYLKAQGIKCWPSDTNRRKPRKGHSKKVVGVPDIVGYLPSGLFLGIEVKLPKGKSSPEQKTFITNANKANCVCFVARSVEDVKKALF